MKAYVHGEREFGKTRTRSLAAVFILLFAMSLPAFAALGGPLESVQADQVRLNAKLKIIVAERYAIQEMTSPTGTVVREYVSPAGQVFAVTWQGPFVPEMRMLLGSYFEQYSRAARAHRESHVGRVPLDIWESGLVVQNAGHMRSFSGRAYDPGLLPEGVSADDIR